MLARDASETGEEVEEGVTMVVVVMVMVLVGIRVSE